MFRAKPSMNVIVVQLLVDLCWRSFRRNQIVVCRWWQEHLEGTANFRVSFCLRDFSFQHTYDLTRADAQMRVRARVKEQRLQNETKRFDIRKKP